jgi:hypothetical protein
MDWQSQAIHWQNGTVQDVSFFFHFRVKIYFFLQFRPDKLTCRAAVQKGR